MRIAIRRVARVLLLDASLLGRRRLFFRLRGVDGFGLFLSALLLVRFGGFVAHGFSGFDGLVPVTALDRPRGFKIPDSATEVKETAHG
jgi:hypothetical protein